jgi:N-acyl-L-homoserine lactone synthetase
MRGDEGYAMQIKLIDADTRLHFSKHLIEMHHDRKRVFIDQLGWQLPTTGSWLEVDEFDNEYTAYLIACSAGDERHLASVRLLPTTRPHMLSTIFAGLCDEGAPAGENVWEISRFTVAPIQLGRLEVLRLCQYLAVAHVEFALLNNIRRYTLVGEAHRLPILCAMGWKVTPLSLPTECEGKAIVAVQIAIEEDTLPVMRRRLGIDDPVLEVGRAPVVS